ncbi:MAG: hypothetical protein AAF639_36920 [Chloroflexota bacterium]
MPMYVQARKKTNTPVYMKTRSPLIERYVSEHEGDQRQRKQTTPQTTVQRVLPAIYEPIHIPLTVPESIQRIQFFPQHKEKQTINRPSGVLPAIYEPIKIPRTTPNTTQQVSLDRTFAGNQSYANRKMIQRDLIGSDPLDSYQTNPDDRSLLYGVANNRSLTKHRIKKAGLDQDRILTIDDYNRAVGINNAITISGSLSGLYQVRQALNDPNNWSSYLPHSDQNAINTKPELQAWIRALVRHKDKIGLYDFGARTYRSMFHKYDGVYKILAKDRLTKNRGTNYEHVDITANNINAFLSSAHDSYDSAMASIRSLNEDQQGALSEWIYKAFFRRTSKLGIDFAINDLGATVHFNTAGMVNPLTDFKNIAGGLRRNNETVDQSSNRPITISEYRHIQKGFNQHTLNAGQVNFYDEF